MKSALRGKEGTLPFSVACVLIGTRFHIAPQDVAEWPLDWWMLTASVLPYTVPETDG